MGRADAVIRRYGRDRGVRQLDLLERVTARLPRFEFRHELVHVIHTVASLECRALPRRPALDC